MGDEDVEDKGREGRIRIITSNPKCVAFFVLSALVVVFAVTVSCLVASIHKVNEGKVGIYIKNGALLDAYTNPGVNTMAPWVTVVKEVGVRPQTDVLEPIKTVTKDSILITFADVQVFWHFDICYSLNSGSRVCCPISSPSLIPCIFSVG